MNFVAVKFTCDPATAEIVLAVLSEIGFDVFEEKSTGIDAYIEESKYDSQVMVEMLQAFGQAHVSYETAIIPKENWNELWEKNYDPIVIEDKCIIKAPFHQIDQHYPIEILVVPKMSFGTGHHATTYQMALAQMGIRHKGKKVLDLGTGTGILAIMAHKLEASYIEATDIDAWCIQNSQENFELNGIEGIHVSQFDAHTFQPAESFDIVLANINKNVLLDEMQRYAHFTIAGGYLLLSGFYTEDKVDIEKAANDQGFELYASSERDNWAQMTLIKNA